MKTPTEISPYSLIQEHLRHDPWRLLVVVIMLNQASAKQARPVWEKFFERWPTPHSLCVPDPDEPTILIFDELRKILRPIGFQNRRAERIWRMTFGYICCPDPAKISDPTDLYGIGKYGSDSYKMFVYPGEIVEDVEDKELRNYVRWAKDREGRAGGPVERQG